MIAVALKGLLGRKLRADADGVRDRPGRRDDQRRVRAHRHARQELRRHLRRVVQIHRRSHQLEGRRSRRRTGRPKRLRSRPPFSATSRTCPACASRRARSRTRRASSTRTGRRSVEPGQGVAMGVESTDDQSLNPFQLVSGEWPSGDGQIAIDSSTAEKERFEIGQTVGAYGDGPLETYEISGIVRFGSEGSLGGITVLVFDLATAERLFDKEGKFDLISVGAKEGVTEAELVRQIDPLLSDDHAGEDGRGPGERRQRRHPGGTEHHQVLPARLRRHRAVRRQLRDRQHARDHSRAADARARHAAHPRSLQASGAVVGRPRVARRRPCRLGDRALPRARHRGGPDRRSSSHSASTYRAAGWCSPRGRSSSASASAP